MPVSYIRETVIPTTNQCAKQQDPRWTDLDLHDFLHVLDLHLNLEVYEIHGPCKLHWCAKINDLFPGMNFDKVTSYKRFGIFCCTCNFPIQMQKTNNY